MCYNVIIRVGINSAKVKEQAIPSSLKITKLYVLYYVPFRRGISLILIHCICHLVYLFLLLLGVKEHN